MDEERLYHRQCRRGRPDPVKERVERCGLEPTSTLGRIDENNNPLYPPTHRLWFQRGQVGPWGDYEKPHRAEPHCDDSYRVTEQALRDEGFDRILPDDQYIGDPNSVMIEHDEPFILPQSILEHFDREDFEWKPVPRVAHSSINCERSKWDELNQSKAREFRKMGLNPFEVEDVKTYYRRKFKRTDRAGKEIDWVDDWWAGRKSRGGYWTTLES